MENTNNGGLAIGEARGVNFCRRSIYTPSEAPGFVAWTTAFDYGNGSVGLVFKQIINKTDPDYTLPKIEFAESVASPASYSAVTWGAPDQCAYRVYLRSDDNGESFYETGRARENIASYTNVGHPDGRISGFHVPNVNEAGTAWSHYIQVSESEDGGSTWKPVARLLEGNAIYLWRVRRLKDSTIILLASFYGSPWGPEHERPTRNTLMPGEDYTKKLIPFFMASTNGRDFTGPHYILPATGAHEYDVVELDDETLLFITGDVQSTPVARQKVLRQNGRYINRPVQAIVKGAPKPGEGPRSGSVPESIVRLPSGLLVGSRRGRPYMCSADEGENWYEVSGLPKSLYQPFMHIMPDGTVANFGHRGGDTAPGQAEMYIGGDFFTVEEALPKLCRLIIERLQAKDGSHYINGYRARLLCGDAGVEGQEIAFNAVPNWNTEEENLIAPPENAPHSVKAVTNSDGWAYAEFPDYDKAADIHFSYMINAVFPPDKNSRYSPCESPKMSVSALRPHRNKPFPYNAYFAEGVLYLSPALLEAYPGAIEKLEGCAGENSGAIPENLLEEGLLEMLLESCVLFRDENGALRWRKSVHAPAPLAGVKPMIAGDLYE